MGLLLNKGGFVMSKKETLTLVSDIELKEGEQITEETLDELSNGKEENENE